MKTIYILHNVIFILIQGDYNHKVEPKYIQASRNFGVNPNIVYTKSELETMYPNGAWLTGINVSDTITYTDK